MGPFMGYVREAAVIRMGTNETRVSVNGSFGVVTTIATIIGYL